MVALRGEGFKFDSFYLLAVYIQGTCLTFLCFSAEGLLGQE